VTPHTSIDLRVEDVVSDQWNYGCRTLFLGQQKTFQYADMSYRTTGHPSQLRHQSLSASATTQSSALQQRINEKRVELEHLKQLRDLSAGLAGQMEQLEEKLGTLSDGTEGMRYGFVAMIQARCRY